MPVRDDLLFAGMSVWHLVEVLLVAPLLFRHLSRLVEAPRSNLRTRFAMARSVIDTKRSIDRKNYSLIVRIVGVHRAFAIHWALRLREIASIRSHGICRNAQDLKARVRLTLDYLSVIGAMERPNYVCIAVSPARLPAVGA